MDCSTETVAQSICSVLEPQIAYFDRDENSTGHLTALVADLAQKINGLMGVTQGTIVQSFCESRLPGIPLTE